MPTVSDVLRVKGQSVVAVEASATVAEAVKLMNARHVGAVIVLEEGRMTGIFTERDVLRRVVAADEDPHRILVSEVMTRQVLCCEVFTDLDEIAQLMQTRRVRHLPIRDAEDGVVGMISIGDINAFNVQQKQATIDNMTDYICGRS